MESIFIGILIIAVVILAYLVYSLRNKLEGMNQSKTNDPSFMMIQQQVDSLRQQIQSGLDNNAKLVNQQLGQMSQMVQQASATVSGQVNSMTQVAGQVQSKLGQLEEASKKIFDVGKELNSLQEILQAPKLRGGLGEYFLEEILKQILPTKYYKMQHTFKSGERVDAAIILGERIVPVDSKFPLESFRRLMDTREEESKIQFRKQFVADVKKHIDSISDKYIQPSQNTYDFALMYIPAENVYYETILKDDNLGEEKSLLSYALKSHVIPVSPNSFYAYLQTIVMGLRGFEVEKRTQDIIRQLSQLQIEFGRFHEDFNKIGKHISNLTSAYTSSEKRFDKFSDRVERVTGIRNIADLESSEPEPPLDELPK